MATSRSGWSIRWWRICCWRRWRVDVVIDTAEDASSDNRYSARR